MKRIMLTLAAAAMFSATATFAQDSTRTQTPTTQTPTQTDQLRKDDMKGWNQVQTSEIPANLRTTLSGSQYSGWENGGMVYKNNAGEYRVTTGTGTTQKVYYFDKSGKSIAKPMSKPDGGK